MGFDIRTTLDFFNKLQEDYREFCKDKTDSRNALNCAMTAWHITDWAYNEFNQQLLAQFPTLPSFQQDIKKQCPSLQIMNDITNKAKHYRITRYKPSIKETELHHGAFSKEFSREFDISALEIELNDGTFIYFEDEIKTVIDFWTRYLQTTLNITIS